MSRPPNWATTVQLYCFIKQYTDEHKLPPTQREMADGCYISTGTVNRHLDRLHMDGYIIRREGTKRGVALTEKVLDCPDEAVEDV